MDEQQTITDSEDDSLDNPHAFPINVSDLEIKPFEVNTLSRVFNCISMGGLSGLRLLKIVIEDKSSYGFDINTCGNYWTYPLHYSIVLREEQIALYLISIGADINLLDTFECSPLNYAVTKFTFKNFIGQRQRINIELRKLLVTLLIKGADVSYKCPITGYFPHTEACRSSYFYSYDMLKKSVDKILGNPLGNPIKFKILKDWCDDEEKNGNILGDLFVTMVTSDEYTCIKRIDEICAKGLKELIHGMDNHGETLLHYAVAYNMKKLVKKLILMEIDPSRRNRVGLTAFELASSYELTKHLNKKEGEKMANLIVDTLTELYAKKEKEAIKSLRLNSDSDSPKTDIDSWSDDNVSIKDNECKKDKKSTKKQIKKQQKVNKKKEKKSRYEELTLMRGEDLRLAQILRNENIISLVEFFENKVIFNYMTLCFHSLKENYLIAKSIRDKENKERIIKEKQKIKKIKKSFKIIDKVLKMNSLKNSFLKLRNYSNHIVKYIDDKLFFFDYEIRDRIYIPIMIEN